MPSFSAITFEVKIAGSWVDISADVLADPPPKCNRGISDNDPLNRVADVGRLTFSLNNAASNSGHKLGYYSPGHTNCRSGWTVGLFVRVSFSYKGFTRYKFYGQIEKDGITVLPGTHAERRVDVSCIDYIGIASNHILNLTAPNTSKTPTQTLALVTANMPQEPLNVSSSFTHEPTFTYVLDILGSETTAYGEMNKIVHSAIDYNPGDIPASAYLVVRGNQTDGETLVLVSTLPSLSVPNFTTLNKLLLETGDKLLLEDGSFLLLDATEGVGITDDDLEEGTQFSYGKHIYNYFTFVSYPRRIDAAATTVLWTLEKATAITAGNPLTIRAPYNDPTGGAKVNGTEMVTPVSGTDYKASANSDGTGADLTANLSLSVTFGAAEAEITLTSSSGTLYVGGGFANSFLQLRGKGIYLYDPVRVTTSDSASIAAYGKSTTTIDMKYADNIAAVQAYAGLISDNYTNPATEIERMPLTANKSDKHMYFFLFAEPAYLGITISESVTAFNQSSVSLVGYEWEINEKSTVIWYPVFALGV